MAVAFFLIVIIIYDLDLAALYPGPRWRARVAGMALSRSLLPPFQSLRAHTPLVLFPLLPQGRQATKLIVSPPSLRLRVTTRSPYSPRVRVPEAGRG